MGTVVETWSHYTTTIELLQEWGKPKTQEQTECWGHEVPNTLDIGCVPSSSSRSLGRMAVEKC